MSITREAVLARLQSIPGPDGRTPLSASGALSEIIVHGGKGVSSIFVDDVSYTSYRVITGD